MKTFSRRFLAVAVFAPTVLYAPVVLGDYADGVTAIEKAQLPKFCWAQMDVPGAKGPEYGFPRECGPGMNHYCPGLVNLIRAKSPTSKGKPIPFLRRAEGDTRYTENAMKDFPSCPIRGHVQATKAEVQNLLTMYGAKRSGMK